MAFNLGEMRSLLLSLLLSFFDLYLTCILHVFLILSLEMLVLCLFSSHIYCSLIQVLLVWNQDNNTDDDDYLKAIPTKKAKLDEHRKVLKWLEV